MYLVFPITLFINLSMYGFVCVQRIYWSVADQDDLFVTSLIIIIKSEY